MQLLLILLGLVGSIHGARILALLPLAVRSHHIFFQSVLMALANNGHEVVVYSPFPQEKRLPNYVDIYINTNFSLNNVPYEQILKLLKMSRISNTIKGWTAMDIFTEETFQNENVQLLIKSKKKFDLVITAPFLGMEALLGFGHRFNAPTVALHPLRCYGFVNRALGNPLSLAHIPDSSLPFSNQMTFYQRIINSYSTMNTLGAFYLNHIPKQQKILDRYLKIADAPSLRNMVGNIALTLANSHPTIHNPHSLTPNIIPIGGIHVVPPKKNSLPQDIQRFMDEANHGVIYFSLGSVVPDHLLPTTYFENFTRVFQRLPQRVLWKTHSTTLKNLPSNVRVLKWTPTNIQQAILVHPNLVLLITHGGLLSLMETIYAGVPVVGIPFFSDQPMNVHYYEQQGMGVQLDFLDLSEEKIYRAVQTVIKDPRYKANAVRLSGVFRDVPMSPADSAVFWVEHVLKYGGAPHLKPAAAFLNWYQLSLVDVLFITAATVLLIILTTVIGLIATFRIIKSYTNLIIRQFYSRDNKS